MGILRDKAREIVEDHEDLDSDICSFVDDVENELNHAISNMKPVDELKASEIIDIYEQVRSDLESLSEKLY